MKTITDRLKIEFPTPDELANQADERVCVYCRDTSGKWWRTYVEPMADGEPHVLTERVEMMEPTLATH